MRRMYFAIVMLLVLAVLIAQEARAPVGTIILTVEALNIGPTTAQLHGTLSQMGQYKPLITQGPRVAENGAASFSFTLQINSTDSMVLVEVARGFNCGTISAFTLGGQALTFITGTRAWVIPTSGGLAGLNWTGVEQWYILNPPVGASVTLAVTWTSACDANSSHFLSAWTFSGTTGTPTATGTQNNSGGSSSGTITFTFSGTNSTQWESTVISDGREGGSGDASLVNQTGYTNNWTSCRSGNEHCAAGGLGVVGVVTWQVATPSFYSASGAVVSGNSPQIIDCFFQYGKTSSLGLNSARVNLTTPGEFFANLTGLDTGTTYYFRAVGNHSYALVFDVELTFTTQTFTDPTVSNAFYNAPWILGFIAVLTLMLYGAWKVKGWRERHGL